MQDALSLAGCIFVCRRFSIRKTASSDALRDIFKTSLASEQQAHGIRGRLTFELPTLSTVHFLIFFTPCMVTVRHIKIWDG